MHFLFVVFMVKKWRSNAEVSSVLWHVKPSESTVTKDYFILVLVVAEFSYVAALWFCVWSKAVVFQRVANSYHHLAKFEEEEHEEMSRVDESLPLQRLLLAYAVRIGMSLLGKRFMVGVVLCLVFSALAVKDFWDEYDEEIVLGKPLLGKHGYLIHASKQYFFLDHVELPYIVETVLSAVYVLVCLQYSLFINLGNLLYFILALMIANLGNNFETLLQLKDVTGEQVLGEYRQAKEFVKYINDELGLLTLFLVISAVPYYATVLPYVLNNDTGKFSRVVYGLNLANYGLILYLTSTLLEKMKKIPQWLREREECGLPTGVTAEQERIVTGELGNDSVALSAFGFFSVSYATIGRIMQILMTYGFIAGEKFDISDFA